MRCNNCGWDNDPGASNCIKCGHQLHGGGGGYANQGYQPQQPAYQQQAPQGYPQQPQGYGGGEQMPRPTVVGASMQQDPMPRPTVIGVANQGPAPRPTRVYNPNGQEAGGNPQPQGSRNCPNCGYPVVGDFTTCPNCGTKMAPATPAPQPAAAPAAAPIAAAPVADSLAEFDIPDHVTCQSCGTEVSTDFSFCPKCGSKVHLPTVRAIKHKPAAPKPKFTLELLLEEDEITQPRTNEYEGTSVVLNRENTEPDNRTITSKEQAEISIEDGKWYIINKSELGSTYIEAGRKFEIQPGDVVVMGDRRFKFEPK